MLAVSNPMWTGILALVATTSVTSFSSDDAYAQASSQVTSQASSTASSQASSTASSTANVVGDWMGPHPAVLYLPALDISGGGAYEDGNEQQNLSYVGKVALGVHRLSQTTLLTLAVQGGREGQRWMMGMDGEVTHLRSGLGLQLTSLRDLSLDRWGGHGALVVTYLRAGVSWYEGGLRVYSLTARVPLTLLGSWLLGGL